MAEPKGMLRRGKGVLLNDLSVPEGRVVPRGKYQLAAGLGMDSFRHPSGPGGWKR